jgi:protein-S-isoprenylcysteine O-methyltransferase Ste14
MRGLGAILLVAGLSVLVQAFVRFVAEGRGTPVPAAAPERLVVGGPYRHVRNPMYVAMLAAIVGQALLLGQLRLLLFPAIFWSGVAAYVCWREEPALVGRFGADYEAYRRAVPAWCPRLRPWNPIALNQPGAH